MTMQRDGEQLSSGEFGSGHFAISIDLGNEAMSHHYDVATAVRGVVIAVENDGTTEGPIRDRNGNTVGRFEIDPPGTRRPILSHDAYRILCGLVHRSDDADPAEVVGPQEAWDQLRHLFPLSDARLAGEED